MRMWYNSQAVRLDGMKKCEAKALRGSLTIEQQEIKVQAKACDENLEISLKKKS